MMPAQARKRTFDLIAEVALNPARAADLAPEMAELGRLIQASPEVGGPFEPPVDNAVCFFHRQVCKRHQICNAHPKGEIE